MKQVTDQIPTAPIDVIIGDEMRKSYLDYAVSVIVDRALPDVRDGLKPVHRRILYAMHDLRMNPGTPYKKSARVAGEVIGKYHPHGDTAVYDAAVGMAQPWSRRVPLIDGQGNFGSIDGDNPAAMRYTEMRLTRAGQAFFDDLEKNTVDFRPNYDGEEREPSVLPVSYPNIWVNGTDGIAVGMATKVLPHNLRETIDAFVAYMDNPDLTSEDILRIIPGPDFPTGGVVYDLDGFREAIETGRGRVRVRAKWHAEQKRNGMEILVLDELPYQTNKKTLVETIAEKVKAKELDDITDCRDESNKDGIRVVIELRKGAIPAVVFNHLIAKKTGVEESFTYNVMLLDGQQPFQMNLFQIFSRFLTFRKEVIVRRVTYDLNKANERLHIVEGLTAALGKMDEVIKLIRATKDAKEANAGLRTLLSIDDVQAQAILDLRLQRLTGMELDSIREEHKQLTIKVADYKDILARDERVVALVKSDLEIAKTKFGEDRRTEISYESNRVNMADLVKKEPCIIHRTKNGYIKRMPASDINTQNRNTKGRLGIHLDTDDYVEAVYTGCTHDMFMVFTESGKTFARRVWQIAEGGAGQRGRHLRNLFEDLTEEISHILFVPEMEVPGVGIVTVTAKGKVKRTSLDEYNGALRKNGVQGLTIEDGDRLVAAITARDHDHIILASSDGKAIRFEVDGDSVRRLGRMSVGVRGIRLEGDSEIIGAMVIPGNGLPCPMKLVDRVRVIDDVETNVSVEEMDTSSMDEGWYMLSVGKLGVGKRTPVSEFHPQSRAGKGVTSFNINKKTGPLVKAMLVREDEELVLTTSSRIVRIKIADVRKSGRVTAGTLLMDVHPEKLIGAASAPAIIEESVDS